MGSGPLVSVIIPAYNAQSCIREALDSVRMQTLGDLEVLVIDDGSEDRTADIVHEAAATDRRIRLLHQENSGVAAARNLGIEHARGVYVAPLDADDIFYPCKLEAQVARLESGGARTGLVYCWFISIDQHGQILSNSRPLQAEGDLYKELVFFNFIGNASVPLYRRNILEQVGGYDKSLRDCGAQGCEDWDLSLRVAERYDIRVAPGYYAGYRRIPSSMSSNCNTMAASHHLVMEAVRQQHPELPDRLFRWSNGRFCKYLAGQALRADRHAEALRWMLLEAVRIDPTVLLSRDMVRIVLRSLMWFILGPVSKRLWPTGPNKTVLRKQLGLPVPAPRTREEIEATTRPVEAPFLARGIFERVELKRWKSISARSATKSVSAKRNRAGDGL
jgi:glycosyltransferase involved in cell wall biosynthesis